MLPNILQTQTRKMSKHNEYEVIQENQREVQKDWLKVLLFI